MKPTTGILRSVKRLATCQDCSRTWCDPFASANAARHANAHGHTTEALVIVERRYTQPSPTKGPRR